MKDVLFTIQVSYWDTRGCIVACISAQAQDKEIPAAEREIFRYNLELPFGADGVDKHHALAYLEDALTAIANHNANILVASVLAKADGENAPLFWV
jgi:hypothetical protein